MEDLKTLSQQNIIISETNFHNFFDVVDDMFIITDLNGRIIYCNRSVIDKLKYSLFELKGMNILELCIIDKKERFSIIVEAMLKEKSDYWEMEMQDKFGEVYSVQTRIWFGKWDNEDCVYCVSKDVTSIKQAHEALKESHKRFMLALDETKAGLWDMDMINNKMFLSPMWKKILGYEDDEIKNSFEAWEELWHPDDRERIKQTLKDYFDGESERYELIHRLKHKDGSWRWMLSRSGVLRDEKGKPYRWIGTNIDITTVHEQSRELESFFSISLDLLCIIDKEGKFLKVNKAWEDVLGYSVSELNGHIFLDFIHKDDISSTIEVVEKIKNGEKVTGFVNRYITIDGDFRYIEWRANSYEDVVYSSGRDITERIQYENKILEISNKDTLTGVYNRRYVYERATEMIEEYKRTGKTFSVCILDIDNFKNINDKYGHRVGDYILKEFTKVIDENLRPYDILGRYGGEEFIVILKDADGKESGLIIERILNVIRNKTFTFDRNDIQFTFSTGIVSCEEIKGEEMIIDKLVELADKRMYYAKNTGRNRIVFKTIQ